MLRFEEAHCEAAVIDLAAHFRGNAADQRGIDFHFRNNFFLGNGFESRYHALHDAVVGLHRKGERRALAPQLLIEQVLIRLRPLQWRRYAHDAPAPLRTIATGNLARAARRFSASPARATPGRVPARRAASSTRGPRPSSRASPAPRPISPPDRAVRLRARRARSAWRRGRSSLHRLIANLVHEIVDQARLIGGLESFRDQIAREVGGGRSKALAHPALRGVDQRGAGEISIAPDALGSRPRAFANPVHDKRGFALDLGAELRDFLLDLRHPCGSAIGKVLSFS